jgi:hypothetical protein
MNKMFISLLFLILIIISGCKKETTAPPSEPQNPYTGITVTGPDGPANIGNWDQDDWLRIVPSSIQVWVSPAFPNPTDGKFTMQYESYGTDSVIAYIDDWPNNKKIQVLNKSITAGVYNQLIDLTEGYGYLQRKEGIVRLFFSVVKGNKTYTTYGDIEYKHFLP